MLQFRKKVAISILLHDVFRNYFTMDVFTCPPSTQFFQKFLQPFQKCAHFNVAAKIKHT